MQPSSEKEVRDMYNETADTNGPVIDTACGSGHMLSLYRTSYDLQRRTGILGD